MPLFATVTISNSIPEKYADVLKKALEDNLKGRGGNATVTHFFQEEEDGLVSFSFTLDDKEFSSTVAPAFLAEEVSNMLFYERSLYADGEVLDYVYSNSYSFTPEGSYHVGDVLKAFDQDGRTRGTFYVDKIYENAVVLRPLYLADVRPGMKLEKAFPLRFSIFASTDFKLLRKNVEVFFQYPTVTYPVHPTLSLVMDEQNGKSIMALGFGVGSDFSFASLFPEAFSLLRNASLRGDAEFLLCQDGTTQGRFHVLLDTAVTSHLTLGVGLVAYGLSAYGVGFGGGFTL